MPMFLIAVVGRKSGSAAIIAAISRSRLLSSMPLPLGRPLRDWSECIGIKPCLKHALDVVDILANFSETSRENKYERWIIDM